MDATVLVSHPAFRRTYQTATVSFGVEIQRIPWLYASHRPSCSSAVVPIIRKAVAPGKTSVCGGCGPFHNPAMEAFAKLPNRRELSRSRVAGIELTLDHRNKILQASPSALADVEAQTLPCATPMRSRRNPSAKPQRPSGQASSSSTTDFERSAIPGLDPHPSCLALDRGVWDVDRRHSILDCPSQVLLQLSGRTHYQNGFCAIQRGSRRERNAIPHVNEAVSHQITRSVFRQYLDRGSRILT